MFKFQHPDHFYALLALPALLLLCYNYWAWRQKSLRQLGEPALLARLLPATDARRFWLKTGLFALALLLLVVAWADPQRGAKQQQVSAESADVFIALDISQSMLAKDQAPSRLEFAKVFAKKLVQALEGERIGLIFFAGDAFLQMPLSTDYGFLIQSIQAAEPDLITAQGTAIPAAIELARRSFGEEPGGGRALLLISDGENHDEDALEAAEEAYGDGVVICTIGAGTAEGSPIPTGLQGPEQYKKDESGAVVRSRLDEGTLQAIARAGAGQYFNLRQNDAAIRALQRVVGGLSKRQLALRSFTEYERHFQWFVATALLLLFVEKVRR
jgi:Ca-activated chloride channel family protein